LYGPSLRRSWKGDYELKRRNLYIEIVLACVIIVAAVIVFLFNSNTTILVIRHAEKTSNDTNANLSNAGKDRAQRLVGVAKDAGVSAIYTTEFCRTSQTAQPLAHQLGLPLIVLENDIPGDQLSDCDPKIVVPIERLPVTINSIEELVAEILSKNSGEVILIVGHRNSVPQIIHELGVASLCPDYFPMDPGSACNIPENEFDNIFIATVLRFFGNERIVKAKYGN
jgi:broad specificity phosphatase PhoE